jgi:uncharacterized protein (TIGR02271 family)
LGDAPFLLYAVSTKESVPFTSTFGRGLQHPYFGVGQRPYGLSLVPLAVRVAIALRESILRGRYVGTVNGEEHGEGFTAIEERFANYEVYDQNYEKIGKVDDLFVDEQDNPEYIGVKMGFLGTRSTLIPMDIVRVNDERHFAQVAADKETVKDGPTYDDDQDITPEFENEVYSYYGLQRTTTMGEHRAYGGYYAQGTAGTTTPRTTLGATGRTDLPEEDEVRVRRVEEELVAGTREREVGAVRVRKRVVTEHQRMEVPTRREEVRVERVPVEGEVASEVEIGEDEVVIPVSEEEVVVEKRPVAKEEIRIHKEVVEDTEVVEEDVRREEVDIDDEATGRTP